MTSPSANSDFPLAERIKAGLAGQSSADDVARALFGLGIFGDDLPGTGRWQPGGSPVAPAALACPAIDVVAQGDRIVPAPSAAGLPDRHPVAAGHVGMVVGSRAPALLWQPLADWISRVPAPR